VGRLLHSPRAKLSMADIRRFRNNISIAKIQELFKNSRIVEKSFSLVRSKARTCTYRKMLHKYYLFQVNNKSILKLYYQKNIFYNDIIVIQKKKNENYIFF